MNNDNQRRAPARMQLAMIAALFLGPLVLAAWLYYGGSFTPSARSNHGLLLDPVVQLPDMHPALPGISERQWLLVYANDSACGEACVDALFALRQSRLMLGNDMTRLTRVFLRGPGGADTVPAIEQDGGLEILQDASLLLDLRSALPADTPGGGFFLIDPLGNLVMYFRPDLDPRAMVDDIKHLLKLSHIG